jgi:hypothetical protein
MRRKTAPKVKGGIVQKKNNWELTPRNASGPKGYPAFERRRPADGYRHLLKKRDIERFIDLLPDWDELAVGLQAIVLDDGDHEGMGWCAPGVVAICAWEEALWWNDARPRFVDEHRDLFVLLGVDSSEDDGRWTVRWTEGQARAFQLLHIFLHELGHHHDRMTTRDKRYTGRGEPYAEEYARQYFDRIWDSYLHAFGQEL